MVEVDEQAAGAFARRGSSDFVGEFADVGILVVTIGLHTLLKQYGGLVGVLPGDVEQTIVGAEASSLQRHLRGCEGITETGLEEESDGVAFIGSRTTFSLVLLLDGHEERLADVVGIETVEFEITAPVDFTVNEKGAPSPKSAFCPVVPRLKAKVTVTGSLSSVA